MSEPFGNVLTPFAEPAWYSSLSSPYYTAKHRALRAVCRAHTSKNAPYAAEWESAGQVPHSIFLSHASSGFLAASIYPPSPSKYLSGIKLPAGIEPEDWDIWCDIIVTDEGTRTGYLGVNWALGGGNGIGAPPLVVFGTEEQKQRILVPILKGEKRICLGITEAGGGSDVASLKTWARKIEGGWIVNGSKKWITNAIFSDYMTTAVRTGAEGSGAKGISLLIIDLHAKGVTMRKIENTGVNASGSTYVELEDVFVPLNNLIGKENQGFPIVMSNFLHGKLTPSRPLPLSDLSPSSERLVLCVAANRMSRTCIEDAYEYACDRSTFGVRLIDQPIIRAKFSDMGRLVEANQAWIEQIAYHMSTTDKKQADLDLAGPVALLKVSCTRALEFCNREALQVLGGIGYQRGGRGGRVEAISRDLRVMCVGGGSDEIMGQLGLKMVEMTGKMAAAKL